MHHRTPRNFSSPLLTLALALSACGRSEGSLGENPAFTGQLDGWNRGAGFTLQAIVQKSPTSVVIASAPIDAAGNFSLSLTLPGSAIITPLLQSSQGGDESEKLPEGCTGNPQSTPGGFSFAPMAFQAVSGATTLLSAFYNGLTGSTGSPQVRVSITYVDRDYDSTGTVTCLGATGLKGGSHSTSEIHFKPGWNRLVETYEVDNKKGSVTSTVSSGPPPDGLKWFVIEMP